MLRRFHLTLFTLLLLFTVLQAQSFNKLLTYYHQHRTAEFESEASKIDQEAIRQNPDLEFFQIVMQVHGEEAVPGYERLYKQGSERVRFLAAEKLKEYHYARGYYITAAEYEKYLIRNEDILLEDKNEKEIVRDRAEKETSVTEQYSIQVGAFSHRDNAHQLSDMLNTQNINSRIVLRTVGDNKLFCVWIKGKPTLDQTMQYANRIKEKYDLNFRIIKE